MSVVGIGTRTPFCRLLRGARSDPVLAGAFGGHGSTWQVNALRLSEYVLFGLVALFAKDGFQSFLGVVGAATGGPIAFIFPAYFWLRTAGKGASTAARLTAAGCIAVGFAAMIFVGYQLATAV